MPLARKIGVLIREVQHVVSDLAIETPQPVVHPPKKKPIPAPRQRSFELRTLKSSNYLKAQAKAKTPKKQHQIFAALDEIIHEHCLEMEGESGCDHFYNELEKDIMRHKEELVEAIPFTAQRLWTSEVKAPSTDLELCSILNAVIRSDKDELMKPLHVIVKAIKELLVAKRGPGKVTKTATPGGLVYRGTGFPDTEEHRRRVKNFYAVGCEYRVPGFLATSLDRSVAREFAKRSWTKQKEAGQNEAVCMIFTVEFDKDGCQHAALVEKSNVEGEGEFLFTPYSVFSKSGTSHFAYRH